MNKTKKIAFYTLGCKLNFSEASSISKEFSDNGFDIVDFKDNADYYVINTCAVTESAEKKCRGAIRQAIRRNNNAIVAVIGCFSQLKADEIKKIEGIDIILGSNDKFKLFEKLKSHEKNIIPDITVSNNDEEFISSYSIGDRTRSFFKIQDGCDYFCTYCTVPLARGCSRSDTIENTIKTAKEIAKTNIKEIVLTGVNIGDFGKKNNQTFFDLLKEIEKIENIDRIRISSIEPNLLDDKIIELVAQSNKFLPHFHIPLQSGSNKILSLMKRRYNRELFENRLTKIKSLIPDCCIAIDVITGFPGETDVDFDDTYRFIESLDISYLHVFTYSERENTSSTKLIEKVPVEIRQKRTKQLILLSDKKKANFYKQNIGKTYKVLFESDEENGYMFGFTENYIKVKTLFNSSLINEIRKVKLLNIDKENIFDIEIL